MDNSAAAPFTGEYADGELLLINGFVDDSWYNPVTVVRDGMTGYMRNFLVSPISEAEAEKLLAGMEATPNRRSSRRNSRRNSRPSSRRNSRLSSRRSSPSGSRPSSPAS